MWSLLTWRNDDKDQAAAVTLMAGVFLYTLARAALAPVFHDEAYTYFVYGRAPLPVVLSELGNNHILNTLFIKCSVWLFGMSELSLRLPALVGHLFFLTGVYRALGLFLRKKAFFAGAVLLTLNLFVLELFSAGRGYALGLGFFMQAMYYFLRSRESRRTEDVRVMFSFLALAVLSHLSFLFVYVPAFVMGGTDVLFRQGWSLTRWKRAPGIVFWRGYRFPLLLTGLLFLALKTPVLVQMKTGGFYHGGGAGFWPDTVRSLGEASFYNQVVLPERCWFLAYAVLTAGAVLIGAFLTSRRMKGTVEVPGGEKMLTGMYALLLGSAGVMAACHHALGVKYIIGRMAVFLIPLFWLTVTLFWACLFHSGGRVRQLCLNWAAGIAVAVAVALFLSGMNFKKYTIAPDDYLSRDIIRLLQAARQEGVWGGRNVTLGTHFVFVPSLYFYSRKNHLTWLEVVDLTNTDSGPVSCDAYYIFEPRTRGILRYDVGRDFDKIEPASTRVLARYPAPGTVLAFSSP
jgi:hypothetical protein